VFEWSGRDYGYFFAESHHFRDADLSIVNFEGTLTDTVQRAPGRRWYFRAPPEFVRVLTEGGIDAASVANNHIGDFGRAGQEETIQTLKDAGIAVHGMGEAALVERQGISIGLLGYDNLNSTGVRAAVIIAQAAAEIAELRERGAQLVIVSVHWGLEYVIEPTANQQSLGRALIDAGADLVLGTHPHIWQGIERYNGRYIVYSMGNFVFGGNTQQRGGRLDPDTGIVLAEFDFLEGRLMEARLGIAPYRQALDGNWNLYQPYPLTGGEAGGVLQKILDRSALIDGGITAFSLEVPYE
jgi:poly-gamma-glutamate synthesis protein (capsule biosynthesis protein)